MASFIVSLAWSTLCGEDFVTCDPQSRRVFSTEVCLDCEAGSSVHLSPLRQKLVASARSSDDVFGVPVTQEASNTLVCVSARSFRIVSKCDEDQIVVAPPVICLIAADSLLPLLLKDTPTALVVDASTALEVEEPNADQLSAKRIRLCGTTHPIASMSHSMLMTDHLSNSFDVVQRTGINVQFAETENEIHWY